MFIVLYKKFNLDNLRCYHENKIIANIYFNPNSIGVKYSLIVLGGGGGDNIYHVSVLTFDLLIGQKIYFFKFWIETLGICHGYAVSNRKFVLFVIIVRTWALFQ